MNARKATKKSTKRKVSKTKKITAVKKMPALKEAMSKTQLLTAISEDTGLSKKEIQSVLSSLEGHIERHVKKRSVGQFSLPGLLKVVVVRKPATKARKGINPFTGEPTIFKAKPARNVVKVRPLKKLKDMAE